ncbi:hypothetical protein JCM8208_004687 [Rhodotorula glutinis]
MAKRTRPEAALAPNPFTPRDPDPSPPPPPKHNKPDSHPPKPTSSGHTYPHKPVDIAPAPSTSSTSFNPPSASSTSTATATATDDTQQQHKKKKHKKAHKAHLSSLPSTSAHAHHLDPTLDPTLAGLLRDEPAAFPAGDIPVDPSLMQLADVATAPAPLTAAGSDKPHKKERKHKDKKDKGKRKADDHDAAAAAVAAEGNSVEMPDGAPAYAANAGKSSKDQEQDVAKGMTAKGDEHKDKKRRGRPPKAKDAAASSSSSGAVVLPVPGAPPAARTTTGPVLAPQAQPGSSALAGSAAAHFYEDLVTKWMSSKQLKELADAAGCTYSSGKFTTTEDATIDAIVAAFCAERDYSPDDFRSFLVVKRAAADKQAQRSDAHDLWERLGRALGTRPLLAIYNHVRARYPAPDAFVAKGERWSADDDERLRQAVVEMGNSWERVGTAVGRAATSCRDRWTKQLVGGHSDKKKSGAWTGDEEEVLRALVQEHGNAWKIVSAKMDGTRSATQCRTKWNDYLKRRDVFSNATSSTNNAAAADNDVGAAADGGADSAATTTPGYKWRPEDSSRLVHLIASHQPQPHSIADLPWSSLTTVDPELEPHGTKNLRDRFRTLASYAARAIRVERGWGEGEEVAFSDILPRLIAQHPSPTGKPLRRPRADPKPKLPKVPKALKDAAAAGGEGASAGKGKAKGEKKGNGKGKGKEGAVVAADDEGATAGSGRAAKGAYKSKETVETEDEASGAEDGADDDDGEEDVAVDA